MTIALYRSERRGLFHCRDAGTDICLNCPLSEVYLSSNGNIYETCEQSGWHANRKEEPKCLIALAKFYNVELDEAEQIAKEVGLHPQRKITAWRYAQELKERAERQ